MNRDNCSEPVLPKSVNKWLSSIRDNPQWQSRAAELLVKLINIDTSPQASPSVAAEAEREVFRAIQQPLTDCGLGFQIEFVPIREDIGSHPYFTFPYYADQSDVAKDEVVKSVYANRGNLFARLVRPGKSTLAINAHVDTVAPFIAGRVEGGTVYGRGAVDDKGACLTILLAVELLGELAKKYDIQPACGLLLEFVIDEETGGNGSISAALEKEKGSLDAIVVVEATDLQAHPGNRGAVWYEAVLKSAAGEGALLEAAAFVVGALEECGRKIKEESDHPLFPHRPVQTCHGRLADYGEHPSRVNDYIPLILTWRGVSKAEVVKVVDQALDDYCRRYGDKTQPGVGDEVLEKHLQWSGIDANSAKLEVFGLAGHMGAVDRLDGAITKAATIVRELVKIRQQRDGNLQSLTVTLEKNCEPGSIILEGGQGFLPTHELAEICDELEMAAQVGLKEYLKLVNKPADAVLCAVTFDKLHNAAFARSSDGPAMTALLSAGRETGVYDDEPIRGWDVSCDARIFAKEFPEAEVITFGPGKLAQAHANDEHVVIKDVLIAAETLARMALEYGRKHEKT